MLLSVLLPLVLNTIIFYNFLSFNAVHCTFQLALFRRRMAFVISAKFYSTDHLSRWRSLNSDHWNERASHSNKRNETRYPSFESIKFVHLTPQYPKITLKAVSDKVHPSWILHDSVGSRALSLVNRLKLSESTFSEFVFLSKFANFRG